jgi:hypothetical protein
LTLSSQVGSGDWLHQRFLRGTQRLRPYLRAALEKPRVLSERKTGRTPAQRPARFLAREDCRLRVLLSCRPPRFDGTSASGSGCLECRDKGRRSVWAPRVADGRRDLSLYLVGRAERDVLRAVDVPWVPGEVDKVTARHRHIELKARRCARGDAAGSVCTAIMSTVLAG